MNITVTINAPELAAAIQALAASFTGANPYSQIAATQAPAAPTPQQPAATPQPQAPYPAPQTEAPQPQSPVHMPPAQPPAYPPSYGQQPPVPPQYAPSAPQPGAAPVAPYAQPGAPVVPVAGAPSYTKDQIAVAATSLMEAGKQNEVLQLLQQFGGPPLTAVAKEHYGALATALRGLGAKL